MTKTITVYTLFYNPGKVELQPLCVFGCSRVATLYLLGNYGLTRYLDESKNAASVNYLFKLLGNRGRLDTQLDTFLR